MKKLGVKILGSGLLISFVLLVQVQDPGRILALLAELRWVPLAVSVSLHFVGLYLSAARWRVLLRVQGIDCRLWPLVQSYLVGGFFNLFLPTRVGGDLVRGLDTRKKGESVARPFGVIVVERVSGLFTLLLLALGALALGFEFPGKQRVTLGVAGLLLAMSLGAASLFVPCLVGVLQKILSVGPLRKLSKFVGEFHNSLTLYASSPKPFAWALFLGALLQVNYVLHYYFIGLALGVPLGADFYFVMVPMMSVLLMLPVTFSGMGLREGGNVVFFQLMGRTSEEAVAFAATSFAMILAFGIVGGFVYAFRQETPVEREAREKAAASAMAKREGTMG